MSTLLDRLNEERLSHCKGGLYHKLQVIFAYNSCRIEGSRKNRRVSYTRQTLWQAVQAKVPV